MATVIRTEFVAFAYWGGKEVVVLTDENDTNLTDQDGNILTSVQYVNGKFQATQEWLTDRRFLNGTFSSGNTNAWSDSRLVDSPSLSYSGQSILSQNSTSIQIDDPDLEIVTTEIINLGVVVEHIALDHLDDGTTSERVKRMGYTCVSWRRKQNLLELDLEDLTDEVLEKTYPQYQYQADDTYLPNLLAEDVGTSVPYVIGRGTKVKATLIKNREILDELLVDGNGWIGNFTSYAPTQWKTVGTNLWSIASNKASFSAGDSSNLAQAVTTTPGTLYGLTFTLNSTAGILQIALRNVFSPATFGSTAGSNKKYNVAFIPLTQSNLPDVGLAFVPDEDFTGSISSVSMYTLAEYTRYNFVFNGYFDKGSTFWTAEGNPLPYLGWLIDDDWDVCWKQAGSTVSLIQDTIVLPTSIYAWSVQLTITILQGSLTVSLGGNAWPVAISATGTYEFMFVATNDDPLTFTPTEDCFCAIDNVVVHPYTQTSITNLITNGTFTSSTGWTLGSDSPWTVDTGEAVKIPGSSHKLSPKPDGVLFAPTVGNCYKVSFDFTCNTGYAYVYFGGVQYTGDYSVSGNKLQTKSASVTWYVVATSTDSLEFVPSLFFDGSIDNISVKEVTPYIYGICEKPDSTALTVSSVYKAAGDSSVIVPTDQYVVGDYNAGEFNLHTLEFNVEQVDFSGNRSSLYADVTRGSTGWNAATEVARLLTWAGLAVNSTSLATAVTNATNNSMIVDWAYGYDGQPTTLRAIIEQLLLILRGGIYTDANNSFCFFQDVASSDTPTVLDESLGDAVEVTEFGQSRAPSTIKLGYRPKYNNPDIPQFTLERTIGALTGEVAYEAPMVYDFTPADKLHNYLTKRAQYNKYAEITVAGDNLTLGDLITLTPAFGNTATWRVTGVASNYNTQQISLVEYNAAVYSYTAGTEPEGGTGYLPDYSQTPPAAPTDLTVESYGGDDIDSWIDVSCTPPSVNYNEVWFQTERRDDNTIQFIQAYQNGDKYAARISGLAHNKDYILYAFAKNKYGLSGYYTDGVPFKAYGLYVYDLPVPEDLNIRNDDTPPFIQTYYGWEGIAIQWSASLDYRVKAYAIEVKKGLGGTYAEVNRVIGVEYSYWVYAVTDYDTYYVRIRAVDATSTQYSDYTDAVSYTVLEP